MRSVRLLDFRIPTARLACGWIFIAVLTLVFSRAAVAQETGEAAMRQMVQADWAAQEKRLGRSPGSAAAITDALRRTRRLLDSAAPRVVDHQQLVEAIAGLERRAADLAALSESQRLELYHEVRWLLRDLALSNPLVSGQPVVFLKRRRFVCQMLHEYLGYFYDGISGGGVFILERPGRSMAVRDLTAGRLPEGNFTTLSLSYDARTIYFAFARKDAPRPDYYTIRPDARHFHIFAMAADGSELRQLTDGGFDDFDPSPLPDGGIAFISTRRLGGFGRCHNPWEPLPVYTLHRMDADGRNIRTLSFHETNEWHPSVLHDGRIVYSRWDYVDRSAANFHGLWACNPDGSNPVALFGNYTTRINAFYQPRAIPGSDRIVCVAGAHHADVGGSLIVLDPKRALLDARSGEDVFDAVEVLTPEVRFPESAGWPRSYFHSPWPLSEDCFLVSFSFDPLPGMSSGGNRDTTGLYCFDRFGNLELLYRDPDIACMYPIPLAAREKPPVVAGTLNPLLGDEGEFVLSDVTRSLFPLPADRPVKELRIFQVLPKSTHVVNEPRIGHANAESARLLLGTVPVEPDGSAYFRAPARRPIYFQAVDAEGRAVQSMRSITYLQPGERRGCVGCHEPREAAAAPTSGLLATRRPPSTIRPGPDGTRPFSFPRLIQPILDRHCVSCHDGSAREGASRLTLRGEGMPARRFSRSYESLRPYVRWQEWGDRSISGTVTRPGDGGADRSRLPRILADANHAQSVRLSDEDLRKIYLWLDANVPFFGVYDKDAQEAQRRGEAVAVPALQ